MIYDSVSEDDPIQQGDIFRDLPRIDISLHQISVLDRDSLTAVRLAEVELTLE